jgi:phosphohistidine phosphatase
MGISRPSYLSVVYVKDYNHLDHIPQDRVNGVSFELFGMEHYTNIITGVSLIGEIIMDLFILRHGEAGKRSPAASKDSERPLTVVGEREVKEISRPLDSLQIKFDRIGTSPLKRAYQTATIVAKALRSEDAVEVWQELKPEGSRTELYRRLTKFRQESSVLIVGHEPYLSTVIGEITTGGSACNIVLKKAGLARIRLLSRAPRITGELRWLLSPKLLKKLAG